jgi:hypothetical protein
MEEEKDREREKELDVKNGPSVRLYVRERKRDPGK